MILKYMYRYAYRTRTHCLRLRCARDGDGRWRNAQDINIQYVPTGTKFSRP
eukprot:SAG31_NODE_47587_length_234_cov_2.614815_1_plen_50_part_01